ncbi:MAG TPA: MliC family protein [Candidatus Paceibacterota bacterium]|nr:MliC family protein [Candidatus Paceibacterota bacterium]
MKKYIFLSIAIVLAAAVAWALLYARGNFGKLIAQVSYACSGGKTIEASLYEGKSTPGQGPDQPPIPGGSAKVSLSDGRKFTLRQTISADGVRYANADESFVFWTKGDGALILENGNQKDYTDCIQTH